MTAPRRLTGEQVAGLVVVGSIAGHDALACARCGVFLWDIGAHYADAHPDVVIPEASGE